MYIYCAYCNTLVVHVLHVHVTRLNLTLTVFTKGKRPGVFNNALLQKSLVVVWGEGAALVGESLSKPHVNMFNRITTCI